MQQLRKDSCAVRAFGFRRRPLLERPGVVSHVRPAKGIGWQVHVEGDARRKDCGDHKFAFGRITELARREPTVLPASFVVRNVDVGIRTLCVNYKGRGGSPFAQMG
jgi:hypothetical protein